MVRTAWLVAGLVALGLGLLGALLPLLPTTVFLLAAAFCFARSSPALHDWLVTHPRFGPPITAWQTQGAISRGGKRAAVLVMAFGLALSWGLGMSATLLMLQGALMLAVSAFLLTRPEPSER